MIKLTEKITNINQNAEKRRGEEGEKLVFGGDFLRLSAFEIY